MKLLRWAVGGASAYVIYRYSIGRKAKGDDVFVTPEKAVARMTGEAAPAKKVVPRRKPSTTKAPATEGSAADTSAPERAKRKRAPRKKPEAA
jgi:hypothetical protein